MAFPELDHTYTLKNRGTGAFVAEVRIEGDGATPMVRWGLDGAWEQDREALGMVLFASDLGLVLS